MGTRPQQSIVDKPSICGNFSWIRGTPKLKIKHGDGDVVPCIHINFPFPVLNLFAENIHGQMITTITSQGSGPFLIYINIHVAKQQRKLTYTKEDLLLELV